jgi:hypothetical protein
MIKPTVEDSVLRIKRLMHEINDLSEWLKHHHIEVRIEPERVQVSDLSGPIQVVKYYPLIKMVL